MRKENKLTPMKDIAIREGNESHFSLLEFIFDFLNSIAIDLSEYHIRETVTIIMIFFNSIILRSVRP
jgi:hypothetical protein